MSVAITRVPNGEDVWGMHYVKYVDIALDSSYPAVAGYVINATDVGLKGILGAQVVGGNKASGKLNYLVDLLGTGIAGQSKTSMALRAFFPTGGANAAPATLANPTLSTGAGSTDNNITPGVAKEVLNTADLSTIIVRFAVVGF